MSKAIPSSASLKPWYKEFWPWFIIGLLATVVIASLITVSIAFRHADDLVIDDYYKVGLAINQRIEHRETAKRFGITAAIRADTDTIYVRLTNVGPSVTPTLLLAHPIEADKDVQLELLPGPDSEFFARFSIPLASGWHWTVSANEPEPWLVSGIVDAGALNNGDN